MSDWSLLQVQYLWKPLLGGIGVALVAGPLGAFMVWRRLAYLGDTLSHSGLLGITLGLALQINVTFGVCVIAVAVALMLLGIQSKMKVASDTILGILSHTTLALGLLLLATLDSVRVDVLGFLYGDILAINWQDVALIYSGGVFITFCMLMLWQPLLRLTVHVELAQVEGVAIKKVQAAYLILLAITVAIAIKIVGVLLITALLVIPAAAARPWAKSPEQMACWASILGAISVLIGMSLSHFWDIPTGPAIVVISAVMLAMTSISRLRTTH